MRYLFTESTAAATHPGLQMAEVRAPCQTRLDADVRRLLRDGLGRVDMDVRWLVHLDGANVLRLWRSWTGHQIYEATLRENTDGVAVVERLEVEQHPDRYRGGMAVEPRRFEEILVSVLDTVREVRAGSRGTTTESE